MQFFKNQHCLQFTWLGLKSTGNGSFCFLKNLGGTETARKCPCLVSSDVMVMLLSWHGPKIQFSPHHYAKSELESGSDSPSSSCKLPTFNYFQTTWKVSCCWFSRQVMSNSSWPHGLQHTRLPCPSPSPRVCPSSRPFNQWCHPTISTSIIPISSCTQFFPSIKVFSNELALCIRWPRYWSFSFSISPSKEYSELISFRIDWFDILAVQGSLKSLLQHHSWKASIFNGPSLQSNSHIHTWLLEK